MWCGFWIISLLLFFLFFWRRIWNINSVIEDETNKKKKKKKETKNIRMDMTIDDWKSSIYNNFTSFWHLHICVLFSYRICDMVNMVIYGYEIFLSNFYWQAIIIIIIIQRNSSWSLCVLYVARCTMNSICLVFLSIRVILCGFASPSRRRLFQIMAAVVFLWWTLSFHRIFFLPKYFCHSVRKKK